MLTIYQSNALGQIYTVPNISHNSLLYLVAPQEIEIEQISNTLSIPTDFLRNPLDINERPRIEKDGDALLIVLNVPVEIDKEELYEEVPYRTVPIGIVHVKNHLVIVTREESPLVTNVITGRYGSFQTHMKTRLTLILFEAIAQEYVNFLAQITDHVGRLQEDLKKARRNRELFGLIHLNKSLVYFSTSLRAMRLVFKRLATGQDIKLYKEDERILHDALVDIEQAAEVTEMRSQSLSNLMDAYAAIISNNLNSVLKILTTLTILMMIPTMFGSIFSMNVILPYEGEWISTVVVGGLIVTISAILIYIFYKTKILRL